MKIKISKSQWEGIGKKAGWMKKSASYIGRADQLVNEINTGKWIGNMSSLNLEKYPQEFLNSLLANVKQDEARQYIQQVLQSKII